MITKQRPR